MKRVSILAATAAAFVMAEILQVDYGQIALAAAIPAVAFYFALFVMVDLTARKTGIGTLPVDEAGMQPAILPRLYLLVPPLVLIALLASGRSARYSVITATAACVIVAYLRRRTWLGWREWARAICRWDR